MYVRVHKYLIVHIFDQYCVDVCHSIEADFVTWKEKLWPAVCTFFDLDMNATGRLVDLHVCVRFSISSSKYLTCMTS